MDTYSTDIKRLLAKDIEEYPLHLPYALAQYVHDTVEKAVDKALDEERKAILTIFTSFQKPGCHDAAECREYIEAALKARATFG